ncbi:hypothetical protein OPU71_01660 [Niveibacterium sp. 24ML]|uniref:hypothetical protein n=1 Tax=Niveibacterium sp. 24ML TaxID=2985512 RepID=UPI00226F0FB1|nr:hypothetical protein [Niveibacterium sp. 24ML]MCX9154824.1 hypothetical protein [Niveibacterium sp. 24ML]
MSTMFDLPHAQYLDAGPTVLPGLVFRDGRAVLGQGRGFLGVLTPSALDRLGAPSQEERVSASLSSYLSVLLQGVRNGAWGALGEGATDLYRFALAQGERHRVHSEPTFRNALFARKPTVGVVFEGVLVTDHELVLRVDPFMRVEQGGEQGFGCYFDCGKPVRVFLAGGSVKRVLEFTVTA